MRKLKEEEEITGSQDYRYPEVRNIQGIPRTRSGLATKLFGIFELKQSGGTNNSCDNNVNLPSMIYNTSAQDCTAGTSANWRPLAKSACGNCAFHAGTER